MDVTWRGCQVMADARLSSVWRGRDITWHGKAWPRLAWLGLAWRGPAWQGRIQHSLILFSSYEETKTI